MSLNNAGTFVGCNVGAVVIMVFTTPPSDDDVRSFEIDISVRAL